MARPITKIIDRSALSLLLSSAPFLLKNYTYGLASILDMLFPSSVASFMLFLVYEELPPTCKAWIPSMDKIKGALTFHYDAII